MISVNDREYDVVLFGATGFTGALTAEYLAAHAPSSTRWALAGRNRAKLDALRDRLGADVPVIEADCGDPASMARIAKASRVVATTVGPYIRHGEPLVKACVDAGTGYVDLTGEREFVDTMYLRHHRTAQRTGARIVHACGFDSIPYDLGVLFTVQQLPDDVPIRVRGYLSGTGVPSGGTLDSALTIFARVRSAAAAHRDRARVEPRDGNRRVRIASGLPGYSPDAQAWVMPLPTIDPHIVTRSARALGAYGPDFVYQHFAAHTNPLAGAGLAVGAASLFALAQVPPARRWLISKRPSGAGPTPEQRARGWFRARFVGEGGGRKVVTEVAGGDPGYGETSKMLAESALCLATDSRPDVAGQLTTAVAMGDALRVRLETAGITFRVLS